MCEPLPRAIKTGSPPTERNALTGEFTPPGMSFCALSNRALDFEWFMGVVYSAAAQAGGELPQGEAQLAPKAALQTEVILASGEHVLDEVFKSRAAAAELHHACCHGVEQKTSVV